MANQTKLARPVLAEGEVTGHAHVAAGATVYGNDDGTRTVVAHAPVTIEHEEHGAVTIPAGRYLSDRVVETDPLDEARRVAD